MPTHSIGPWTLLKASCRTCRDITHRFERDAVHGLFPAVRAVFRTQTRRKRERPRTVPLLIVERGQDRYVPVPLNESPVFLPIIGFHHMESLRAGRPRPGSDLRSSMLVSSPGQDPVHSGAGTGTPTMSAPASRSRRVLRGRLRSRHCALAAVANPGGHPGLRPRHRTLGRVVDGRRAEPADGPARLQGQCCRH